MATHITKKDAREADLLKIKDNRGEIVSVISPHDLVVGIADYMESDLRVIGHSYMSGSLWVKHGASGTLVLPNGQYALRGGDGVQVVDDGDGGFTLNAVIDGSVASAPKNSPYLTWQATTDLSNDKVLKASGPITFDPTSATIGFNASANLTVNSLVADAIVLDGTSLSSLPFLSLTAVPGFTGAKVLGAGDGVSLDTASGSPVIKVDSTVVRKSGAVFTGPVTAPTLNSTGLNSTNIATTNLNSTNINATTAVIQKITGSLTRLADGTPYLRAGSNITLSTGSNGSVTIAASLTSAAPLDAKYLLLSADSSGLLSQERVLSLGAGLSSVDSGAGGSYTLKVLDSQVAFLTGAIFSGPVTASYLKSSGNANVAGTLIATALSGSLTKLSNGDPYLKAGQNVTLSTGSDGSITIAAQTGSFVSGPFLTHHKDSNLPGSLAIIEGDGIQFHEDLINGNFTIATKLAAGPGIDLKIKPTREIVISSNITASIPPIGAAYLLASSSAELTGSRVLSSSFGIKINDGGPGGKMNIFVDTGSIAKLSGSTFTGPTKFATGLSGSLTRLVDGSPFLIAGTGIDISTGSNGSITITNTGPVGDITEVDAGLGLIGGGTTGAVSLYVDPNTVAFLTGTRFTGEVSFSAGLRASGSSTFDSTSFYGPGTFYTGLSGSLTKLSDGSDYLRAGGGISLTTSSDGSVTITNTGPIGDITEVIAGNGLVGGGISGSVTLAIDVASIPFLTGAQFTGAVSFGGGLTGSLTQLVDGSQFLIAGDGIDISTGSNGSITITNTRPEGDITEVIAGNGLIGGGSSGSIALEIDASSIPFLTGAQFTGAVTFGGGLTGSLTQLVDGSPFLIAGTGIDISTGSNGSITITNTGPIGDITEVIAGDGLIGGGTSGSVSLAIDQSTVALLTGSTFTGNVNFNAGLSGSLTTLVDGTPYIRSGDGITISTGSDGSITITNAGHTGDITEVIAGLGLKGGGVSGSVSLEADQEIVAFLTGTTFTGAVNFNAGLSGSLTTLIDGTPFIRAGSGIIITTGSEGWITVETNASASVSVSGRERETVWLTDPTPAGLEITFSEINFAAAEWNEDLIEVYLNGQLQHSASYIDVANGLGDYYITGSNKVVFGFNLAGDDSVDVIAQGGDAAPVAILNEPFVTFSPASSLLNSRTVVAGAGIDISTSTTGQVVISTNATGGNGSAYLSRLAINDNPAGAIDGVNDTYTLARTPSDSSQMMLWLNGQLLTQGPDCDYQVVGNTITLYSNAIPVEDDILSAMYPYVESASRYVLNERINMTQSGVNIMGDLQSTPLNPSKVMLFWNGQLLSQGSSKDYIVVGKTVYLNEWMEALDPDDIFVVCYTAIADNVYYEINEEITFFYDSTLGLWKTNLSYEPTSQHKIMLFMNGQLLRGGPSSDFISSGNQIVMLNDEIEEDFRFYATYEYS